MYQPVLKEGYLEKKSSGFLAKWQSRYFELAASFGLFEGWLGPSNIIFRAGSSPSEEKDGFGNEYTNTNIKIQIKHKYKYIFKSFGRIRQSF